MSGKLNLCVCFSGSGSNLEAILMAYHNGRLPWINPALLITNNPNAGGIEKAKDLTFSSAVKIILKAGMTEEEFGEQILAECQKAQVDAIIMCGFLPIMPSGVIDRYRGLIFNQHPGPLDTPRRPGFGGKGMYGRAVHEAVLQYQSMIGSTFHSCATIHHVTAEVDGGKMVAVHPVEVRPLDTAEDLARRMLPLEHELVVSFLYRLSETGHPGQFTRATFLIQPDNQGILSEAKRKAIEKYPRG